MKKYLYITLSIIALMLCVACTNSEIAQQTDEFTNLEQSCRSIEDATAIALNAYSIFNGKSRTTSALSNQKPIVIVSESKSRSEGQDTLLYIFNYEDNGGFAVVSAAKKGAPLLAYIENGNFTDENVYNGGFQMFMNEATAYAEKMISEEYAIGIEPIKKTKYETTWLAREKIEPRIKVEWGRTQWEGAFCDNNDAEMEGIAAAQILSYYEQPKFVKDYTSNNPNLLATLNWSDIKKHSIANHDNTYSDASNPSFLICPASSDAHIQLGLLCKEINEYLYIISTPNGTYTSPLSIVDCLTHFLGNFEFDIAIYSREGYEEEEAYYKRMNDIDIKKVISEGFMILCAEDDNGQHYTWVADGFIDADIYGNTYTSTNGLTWTLVESHKIDEGLFVHYNWGDYGHCNGYFVSGMVKPTSGVAYDKPWLAQWSNEFSFINELRTATLNLFTEL